MKFIEFAPNGTGSVNDPLADHLLDLHFAVLAVQEREGEREEEVERNGAPLENSFISLEEALCEAPHMLYGEIVESMRSGRRLIVETSGLSATGKTSLFDGLLAPLCLYLHERETVFSKVDFGREELEALLARVQAFEQSFRRRYLFVTEAYFRSPMERSVDRLVVGDEDSQFIESIQNGELDEDEVVDFYLQQRRDGNGFLQLPNNPNPETWDNAGFYNLDELVGVLKYLSDPRANQAWLRKLFVSPQSMYAAQVLFHDYSGESQKYPFMMWDNWLHPSDRSMQGVDSLMFYTYCGPADQVFRRMGRTVERMGSSVDINLGDDGLCRYKGESGWAPMVEQLQALANCNDGLGSVHLKQLGKRKQAGQSTTFIANRVEIPELEMWGRRQAKVVRGYEEWRGVLDDSEVYRQWYDPNSLLQVALLEQESASGQLAGTYLFLSPGLERELDSQSRCAVLPLHDQQGNFISTGRAVRLIERTQKFYNGLQQA